MLTTQHGYEPRWQVDDVTAAAASFVDGGGEVVVEPFDIPVGRVAVVADLSGTSSY